MLPRQAQQQRQQKDDQEQVAFHPAVYSTTGRPLLLQPIIKLADGSLVKYRCGQVVGVVLPLDAASVRCHWHLWSC